MMRLHIPTVLVAAPALVLLAGPLHAQIVATPVPVQGPLREGADVSAIARAGDLLLVAADERNAIEVLVAAGDGYRPSHTIDLLDEADAELDLEGLEVHDDGDGTLTVVATGSHGAARRQPDDDRTRKQNRNRLEDVRREGDRAQYARLRLDARTGRLRGEIERGSLTEFFAASPFFRAVFPPDTSTRPPSKEGGIDIEGLALTPDGELVFGLRGPILLGEFCPVVVAPFDRPKRAEVRFVRLGGLGVRGLARAADGYLILAGPVGEGEDYRLFWWDGADMVPGTDAAPARLADLGAVPKPGAESKAEGVTLLAESAASFTVLVVYDSAPDGGLTELVVPRPE
jgi:hypothetical protein